MKPHSGAAKRIPGLQDDSKLFATGITLGSEDLYCNGLWKVAVQYFSECECLR